MTTINYSAEFITPANQMTITNVYKKKDVLPSIPGTRIEFEVGKVLVTQRVNLPDPFFRQFQFTVEHVWICTREEFDNKFDVTERDSETFALVQLKQ